MNRGLTLQTENLTTGMKSDFQSLWAQNTVHNYISQQSGMFTNILQRSRRSYKG